MVGPTGKTTTLQGDEKGMADYSRYRTLRVERRGRVINLYLHRPDALNAVNSEMHTELSTIFADIATERDAGAVLLTGSGRAFCAGGDIAWMRDITPAGLDVMFEEARKIIVDLLELEIPVIAAVNGAAIGLGATLALFADVVFAVPEARIGDPHVRLGLAAGDGGAAIWPLLVGIARAKEFLMTGDLLDARDAERIGLINHVVAAQDLLMTAENLAERLAAGPTVAIRATKASVNKALRDAVNLVLDTSLAREKLCFHTNDHRGAVMAFLEKRRPVFSGS
jgi:enoyl-CoA hydratase